MLPWVALPIGQTGTNNSQMIQAPTVATAAVCKLWGLVLVSKGKEVSLSGLRTKGVLKIEVIPPADFSCPNHI